ncbi:hypothetical protein [Bradyrhizobium sp. JYMT SZCCT0428]|uniref:hypothetical protein n=1 Tax=Bradyrhizobium sp. JYMT SZCCT0428 TaxID=2807673 RepID=UPI001BAE11C2|nr:hypothetical protein [Bradyrhizobium sp. JYMT SZCCT0428]MBR1149479.1 hypothetical protein [Bradyrhizobium sp. JYMT SZCCT0428]
MNVRFNGDREMMMMVRHGLASAPPWSPIPTPYLRSIAGVDPQLIALARWRGKFPPPLPSNWFQGRTTWTFAADILNWAGDSRSFRQQLENYTEAHSLAIFHDPDQVASVIQLESLQVVSHPALPRWSTIGFASWLNEINRRASFA